MRQRLSLEDERTQATASSRRVTPSDEEERKKSGVVSMGKYLWKDGCMYEGEWKRGKPCGKGKFSWASGATYQGQFKLGRIEGFGTFTNGDSYHGHWKRNLQDGEGRYVWRNGNHFLGHWKNGVVSGRGTLVWANGSRYDGHWDNGLPKGQGLFTSPHGASFLASWNIHNHLVLHPLHNSNPQPPDISSDIIDNLSLLCLQPSGIASDVMPFLRHPCFSGQVKRSGHTVSKGHKNYHLMLNLQLGIRYSVGKEASISRELKPGDFDPKEKFWTRFPAEGSKITPPHQSLEFRWKDYCPMVFRQLRKLFQVDPADYMLSICGNDALRELSSPGKSGSFFYLTQDDRFMIKTVKKSEVKVLLRMLGSYYLHVSKYENSLLTKFYGVHCVKPIGGQKTRFIVMGNLFCSEYPIHRRFDLKGSSHGRTTNKALEEIDETTTLKDLDLNFVFRLQKNWFQDLIKQIERDCEFLEAERIMDYSLLVGLHFRDDNTYEKMGFSPVLLRNGKWDSYQSEKFMRGYQFLEAELQDEDLVKSGRLGANMPARAERMVRRSDFDRYTPCCSEETYDVVLYFGIIDILQDYDISKKLEHAYKSLQVDPSSISAVDPKLYSRRFRDFVGRIFIEDW
ncbi:hypothetical protein Fmac_007776 [Flemingia macrophylla]|uniref:1-phosphatidylinositol-4-phosphate 5-kinase n=1 Tax=Flemingia macrophylla TaxID=520843 RepID=A0ABD1MVH9_9FABA